MHAFNSGSLEAKKQAGIWIIQGQSSQHTEF